MGSTSKLSANGSLMSEKESEPPSVVIASSSTTVAVAVPGWSGQISHSRSRALATSGCTCPTLSPFSSWMDPSSRTYACGLVAAPLRCRHQDGGLPRLPPPLVGTGVIPARPALRAANAVMNSTNILRSRFARGAAHGGSTVPSGILPPFLVWSHPKQLKQAKRRCAPSVAAGRIEDAETKASRSSPTDGMLSSERAPKVSTSASAAKPLMTASAWCPSTRVEEPVVLPRPPAARAEIIPVLTCASHSPPKWWTIWLIERRRPPPTTALNRQSAGASLSSVSASPEMYCSDVLKSWLSMISQSSCSVKR